MDSSPARGWPSAYLQVGYACSYLSRGRKLSSWKRAPTGRQSLKRTRQHNSSDPWTLSSLSELQRQRIQESLYVIKGQQHALLSGSTCSRLGLVARLHNIAAAKPDFVKGFPTLFKGLGKLREPYSIKLRPGIQPM